MIRINLLPTKKQAARATAAVGRRGGGSNAGQWWALGMLIGWVLLGGAGYWLLTMEEEATSAIRKQTSTKNAAAKKIADEIDEEGLEASRSELEAQQAVKSKVEAKRRTPVYVMYELAKILTDARDGGGPEIDEEKLRRLRKTDAQADPNPLWDPSGLWLTKVEEKGGALALEGGARDATDLSEFTRRLRVSARFGRVSHPNFERVDARKEDDEQHLTWKLDVDVRHWD